MRDTNERLEFFSNSNNINLGYGKFKGQALEVLY